MPAAAPRPRRFPLLPVSVYLFALLLLLVYSYSQIDLNLTLSSHPLYQAFQRPLLQLGYFNRDLSTLIYIVILILMSVSYISLLHQANNHRLKSGNIIILVLTTSIILLFAYPAFSHDIFNYIFDARILVHHHQNPWAFTALDFPDDLWTRFMRWTHRPYPYGPAWLLISLPFYLLGLGKFTLTLLSFKLLGALSYLLSVLALSRLLRQQHFKPPAYYLALFAFNPLVIIESLVSPHLDSTMAALMLASLWLATRKQTFLALLLNLAAGLTKYLSLATAPFLLLYLRKATGFSRMIRFSLVAAYLLTLLLITRREILPWYFVTAFALTALARHRLAAHLLLALTPALLIRYAPFLYLGDYSQAVIDARNWLSLAVFAGLILCLRLLPASFLAPKPEP